MYDVDFDDSSTYRKVIQFVLLIPQTPVWFDLIQLTDRRDDSFISINIIAHTLWLAHVGTWDSKLNVISRITWPFVLDRNVSKLKKLILFKNIFTLFSILFKLMEYCNNFHQNKLNYFLLLPINDIISKRYKVM